MSNSEKETSENRVNKVLNGLKLTYRKNLLTAEEAFRFDNFNTPPLRDADFDAKPLVLLLGQYSTGKTTFIRYLLERDFPGQHIGVEPTTDRFIAVMSGKEEKVIPGNAAAMAADKPFRALTKFGNAFLNKFQVSEVPSPLLDNVTFVDTPGVLAGEKQRIGRDYDFPDVVEWFASRADLILLLFDAHKLDISDEFHRTIEAVRNHTDKIRIVLNKADMIDPQTLMRVYGALMWSLGKVVRTPEVSRVYISSFWDKPYQHKENKKLFDAERADLFADLRNLRKHATLRKLNELVKRARSIRAHVLLCAHLRDQMPSFFGKGSKVKELTSEEGLLRHIRTVQSKYSLPSGDFPQDFDAFRAKLRQFDLSKFPKVDNRMLERINNSLEKDIPALMQQLTLVKEFDGDEVGILDTSPFAHLHNQSREWTVSKAMKMESDRIFEELGPLNGFLQGSDVRDYMETTGVDEESLGLIWDLCDIDGTGSLDKDEFAVALYLLNEVKGGTAVPDQLPLLLVPPARRAGYRPRRRRTKTTQSQAPPPPAPRGKPKSKPNGNSAMALYDYEASSENEMTIAEGQTLTVLGGDEDGWTHVELDGVSGYVPSNYIQIQG